MEDKATLADIFDFSFTKFVTPIIVKIAFIVLIVLAGLGWLLMIIAGFAGGGIGGGLAMIIFGGLGFILSILAYRIMFELVMAIFDIKANTDRIS